MHSDRDNGGDSTEEEDSTGVVYLIGAGPGDPELITRKGYRILRESDVVLIDRLAPSALLEDLPASTEMISCGKKPGHERWSQERIQSVMLDRARRGKRVSRLKGGDPMVFGRGGEEVRFLSDHGVRVEVIPGITAASAASSALRNPLTDRAIASEVTLVTGHEAPTKDADELDWECMANCRKTLVIYMGVGRMEEICGTLVEHGRDPETPAAMIERATSRDERILRGTLSTLPGRAREAGIQPPALILIGAVLEPNHSHPANQGNESPSRSNESAGKTKRGRGNFISPQVLANYLDRVDPLYL